MCIRDRSTAPRRDVRRGKTGYSYFIKGPEAEVAFAKLAGCSLAREVGLTVPEVAVCRFGTEKY